MNETKTTTANIRTTPEQKARWTAAAGGPRKLSAWLTELADNASRVKIEVIVPERVLDSGSPEPQTRTSGAGDAVAPQVAARSETTIVEQESSAGQCPRWMHHRSGVYCGTCKKVN